MKIIRKCKAILRAKSKTHSAISLKDRATSVLIHDLQEAESARGFHTSEKSMIEANFEENPSDLT